MHVDADPFASAATSPLLQAGRSQLLIVDVQERLAAAMPEPARARADASLDLIAVAATALGVPTTLTEHVPSQLGHTASWLSDRLPKATVVAKVHFSAAHAPELVPRLAGLDRPDVVVCGMETHVCVLQTAIDLAARGFRVHLAIDACCCRMELDADLALRRAASAGVIAVTADMVAFEWLRRADHPARRTVIDAVKVRSEAVTRSVAPPARP